MFAFARSEPILDTSMARERRKRSREQLARISTALNLPDEAFYEQPTTPGATASSISPAACEALELVGLFETVTDPERRRACLAFVRAAAERSEISKA